jgi:hypothetical protein
MANEEITAMLLDAGADVEASTGTTGPWPLHGPRALHIALGTGVSYGIDAKPLDHSRLRIARMLIERGASVETVADHLQLSDLVKFEGYEDVWDHVRLGLSSEE